MSEYWQTSWSVWLSAFCVLAIYSYLVRDNKLYRTMVQVFIGVGVGYNVIVQWRDILYPRWWIPMLDGLDALLRGGPGSPWGALWVLVGLLGLLWYFQLSRKYLWLSRIVIGITVGVGAGLTFKSQIGQNWAQVVDSFKPLAPPVVGPRPDRMLSLPGSEVTPAVDDPVAFLIGGGRVRAVELMSGTEIWSAEAPSNLGRAAVSGDGVVLESETRPDGSVERTAFDRSGRPAPATVPTPELQYEAVNAEGETVQLQLVADQSGFGAIRADTGAQVWRSNGRPLGVDDGTVFVFESGLRILDSTTGEALGIVPTARPIGVPRWAKYKDPQHDRTVVLVPEEAGLAAYTAKDVLALNRPGGELLWRAPLGDQVASFVQPLRDVALVGNTQRSELWKLPKPAPRLKTKDYADNWVFVITMLSVMTYFLFSFKTEGKAIQSFSKIGRWMLMIGFGAFFGNTVMTRMSYLLDRLMFLIDDWLRPFFHALFG